MSFWNMSNGDTAVSNETTFEISTGSEPIPDKSSVLAAPDDVKWDTDRDGNRYLSIRWSVAAPDAVAGRKIFQKLWVIDFEPNTLAKGGEAKAKAKKDKALKMFVAIDANAGGKLVRKTETPTDDDLALCLIGKQMVIKLGVWEIGGSSGNWVMAVNPKGSPLDLTAATARPQQRREETTPGGSHGGRSMDFDDEIPFAPCVI